MPSPFCRVKRSYLDWQSTEPESLFSASENVRRDVPENSAFVKELLVLFCGIADLPNDDAIGLEFALVGKKKAIAIREFRKTDLLRIDIDLRVNNLRYNLASLINSIVLSLGRCTWFRRSHTLVQTAMRGTE
jgi:hypothetical protein